ncbi:hypothetical protein MBM_08357 [Drepanopeziza brunnea f. sp. 'multigermtubi' MB_m1]|uniref:Uncharacterized protein n=1 Tax=Marssonina brunnea f. sp. multigermtubi (strain MB_m1) TaxID=1072389 RepID=K1XMH5_MARBU|nr:uncharacterized protein MBM_08357 [Drepanopeziza brunnea f. sp. 'multigermtubi' MB_m1]EKD13639.1 hypothetical protein MBM_08357 [Drepanopeziza brunnea f. sp. 'multigermtubi' MB_m1]
MERPKTPSGPLNAGEATHSPSSPPPAPRARGRRRGPASHDQNRWVNIKAGLCGTPLQAAGQEDGSSLTAPHPLVLAYSNAFDDEQDEDIVIKRCRSSSAVQEVPEAHQTFQAGIAGEQIGTQAEQRDNRRGGPYDSLVRSRDRMNMTASTRSDLRGILTGEPQKALQSSSLSRSANSSIFMQGSLPENPSRQEGVSEAQPLHFSDRSFTPLVSPRPVRPSTAFQRVLSYRQEPDFSQASTQNQLAFGVRENTRGDQIMGSASGFGPTPSQSDPFVLPRQQQASFYDEVSPQYGLPSTDQARLQDFSFAGEMDRASRQAAPLYGLSAEHSSEFEGSSSRLRRQSREERSDMDNEDDEEGIDGE